MLPTGIDRPAGSSRAPVLSLFESRLAGALWADVPPVVFPDPQAMIVAIRAADVMRCISVGSFDVRGKIQSTHLRAGWFIRKNWLVARGGFAPRSDPD
jgi:hypothetical protein